VYRQWGNGGLTGGPDGQRRQTCHTRGLWRWFEPEGGAGQPL